MAYIADDVIEQPLTCFMCSPQLAVGVMINDAQYKSINIWSVADVPIVRPLYNYTLGAAHSTPLHHHSAGCGDNPDIVETFIWNNGDIAGFIEIPGGDSRPGMESVIILP